MMESIEDIRGIMEDLVATQEEVNMYYNSLTMDNYGVNMGFIESGLRDEEYYLDELVDKLNEIFNITPKWYNKGFKIKRGFLHRYEVKPPYFGVDKSSKEYVMLSKLLVELHKKYFLNDGGSRYAYTRIEVHMWEIPDFIIDDENMEIIRKRVQVRYR